jgi:hypothetical protein
VAEFSQERCTRRTDELYRAALDRAARMDEGGTGPAPTIQPP